MSLSESALQAEPPLRPEPESATAVAESSKKKKKKKKKKKRVSVEEDDGYPASRIIRLGMGGEIIVEPLNKPNHHSEEASNEETELHSKVLEFWDLLEDSRKRAIFDFDTAQFVQGIKQYTKGGCPCKTCTLRRTFMERHMDKLQALICETTIMEFVSLLFNRALLQEIVLDSLATGEEKFLDHTEFHYRPRKRHEPPKQEEVAPVNSEHESIKRQLRSQYPMGLFSDSLLKYLQENPRFLKRPNEEPSESGEPVDSQLIESFFNDELLDKFYNSIIDDLLENNGKGFLDIFAKAVSLINNRDDPGSVNSIIRQNARKMLGRYNEAVANGKVEITEEDQMELRKFLDPKHHQHSEEEETLTARLRELDDASLGRDPTDDDYSFDYEDGEEEEYYYDHSDESEYDSVISEGASDDLESEKVSEKDRSREIERLLRKLVKGIIRNRLVEAYRLQVAEDKAQAFLNELDAEAERERLKEEKKQREKEKKREKKRKQQKMKEAEKLRKEQAKQEQERAQREEQNRKMEAGRKRKEEEKRRKEQEERARLEKKRLKELERQKEKERLEREEQEKLEREKKESEEKKKELQKLEELKEAQELELNKKVVEDQRAALEAEVRRQAVILQNQKLEDQLPASVQSLSQALALTQVHVNTPSLHTTQQTHLPPVNQPQRVLPDLVSASPLGSMVTTDGAFSSHETPSQPLYGTFSNEPLRSGIDSLGAYPPGLLGGNTWSGAQIPLQGRTQPSYVKPELVFTGSASDKSIWGSTTNTGTSSFGDSKIWLGGGSPLWGNTTPSVPAPAPSFEENVYAGYMTLVGEDQCVSIHELYRVYRAQLPPGTVLSLSLFMTALMASAKKNAGYAIEFSTNMQGMITHVKMTRTVLGGHMAPFGAGFQQGHGDRVGSSLDSFNIANFTASSNGAVNTSGHGSTVKW